MSTSRKKAAATRKIQAKKKAGQILSTGIDSLKKPDKNAYKTIGKTNKQKKVKESILLDSDCTLKELLNFYNIKTIEELMQITLFTRATLYNWFKKSPVKFKRLCEMAKAYNEIQTYKKDDLKRVFKKADVAMYKGKEIIIIQE